MPPTPFSSAGPRALQRLGLNVNAPLQDIRTAYQRLLPAAAGGGYFETLRSALSRGEVKPADADDQLRWLAQNLRIEAPAAEHVPTVWMRAWHEASETAEVDPAPTELDEAARRVLLDELLSLPAYRKRLVDALATAFRAQVSRR